MTSFYASYQRIFSLTIAAKISPAGLKGDLKIAVVFVESAVNRQTEFAGEDILLWPQN